MKSIIHTIALPGWKGNLFSGFLGLLGVFSFAPYSWWLWPFFLFPAALSLLNNLTPLQGLTRSFCFGLGFLGSGISWVHVSIHEFGNAPMWLAVLLTGLLVVFLALFIGLAGYGLQWVRKQWLNEAHYLMEYVIAYPLLWLLAEAIISTIFTGFPWLMIGYSQVDTFFSGFAPVIGVYGVSFVLYMIFGCITWIVTTGQLSKIPVAVAAVLSLSAVILSDVQWVETKDKSISVGFVQPNIPQERKWLPEERLPTIQLFESMTQSIFGADLIVWPEAALPVIQHTVKGYLERIEEKMKSMDSFLFLGIPAMRREDGRNIYFNRVLLLGEQSAQYDKQHLVPFGEYVPLEKWLRGFIEFFDLPMSTFSSGPANQPNLMMNDVRLAPAICYEIAYPSLVREIATADGELADILITVSNDAWFGETIGPLQHFDIARMRAIELGRPLIRGTNNGITALVDHTGKVTHQLPQFTRDVLVGDLELVRGHTPYQSWGYYLVFALAFIWLIVLGVCLFKGRNKVI